MLTVAVTGATGTQGGATARALLAAGHRVRALTRRPESPAADRLLELGAEPRRTDFDDRASIDAALAGADALFVVTTPGGTDLTNETRQGITLVDAAAAAHVGHIVLTTAIHADRGTGIPHFDSKYLVEQHLRGSGVPWTIVAPAAFMENYASGWTLDGLCDGTFAWPMPADRPIALIAAADIGAFAALALQRREQFAGHRIDIASDMRTPAEMTEILGTTIGRPLTYWQIPLSDVRSQSADLAIMFDYFSTVGFDIDVAAVRRAHPEVPWHGFADWAADQDWPALLATPTTNPAPTKVPLG